MDAAGGLLQIALGIVAVATLAGLGLLRGTVVNLRENLADARLEIVDKDRRLTAAETETTRQRAHFEAEITQQKADIEALSRVVTGEVHWVALGQTLDEHHSQAMVHWQRDEELLTRIVEKLEGVA